MKDRFELATFSASEAEAITGVSGQVQRDWRRRGILPEIKRPARHNVLALAEMFTLRILGVRGIGPQVAAEAFPMLPVAVATTALLFPGAIDGIKNPDQSKIAYAANKIRSDFFHFPMNTPRFFITWANGTQDWTDNLAGMFDMMAILSPCSSEHLGSTASMAAGAIILIDTLSLGIDLAKRAHAPFVMIHSPP